MQRTSRNDLLLLHFIVLIWGFTAILGKLIQVSAPVLVAYRTLLAAMAMGVLIYFKLKTFKTAGILSMLGVGAILGAHWILFFGAVKVSNVSICLVGLSTQALFTSFLEPFFKKTKIAAVDVAIGMVVILVLALIFNFESKYLLGLIMSIVCSFMASIFSILNADFAHKHHYQHVVFYEMLGGFTAALILLPLIGFFWPSETTILLPSTTDWLYIGVLAWVCTVVPYAICVVLMKRISVYFLNLTLNLEPVYGILMAYFIFGESEKMTPAFYLGGIVLLATVISYPTLKRKYAQGV